MKIFNLTDVPTAKLKQHGLVGQTIVVGTALVQPGGEAELADDSNARAHAQHLVDVGAVAFDQLPPVYVAARADMPAKQAPVVAAPLPAPEPVVEAGPAAPEPSGKRKGSGPRE